MPGTCVSNLQSCGTVRRYHAGRSMLIEHLGGKCERCGSTQDLEFHHITVRQWVARKTSRWVRLARYRREAALGKVALLCSTCNKLAGKPE